MSTTSDNATTTDPPPSGLTFTERCDLPTAIRQGLDNIEHRIGSSLAVLAGDGDGVTIRFDHEQLRRLVGPR